ncbi:MAG TPA: hypothetical protein VIL41_06690, partial [Coriobacteriia bacterium]
GSGVSQMRFSNDGSTWSSWQAYSTTASWTLTSGDGTKTVYAQFKDNAGNASSATISDTIGLDTVAPTATRTSPTRTPFKAPGPIVLSASDSVVIYYILNGGAQATYMAPVEVTVYQGNGQTIEFWSVDAAGNASTHTTWDFHAN